MLSVTIVSLKILSRTFCNCLSYEKILIMARGKELSNSQKSLIVKHWKDGESYRNISSNLNIPFITINSFIARFKRRNTVEMKNNLGAPRKISHLREIFLGAPRLFFLDNLISRKLTKIQWLRVKSCRKICVHQDCSVTKRTISNETLRSGLKSRRLKKTPLLLKQHRDAARLKSVRQHKEKKYSLWERVLLTDESKIKLFGHNYRNHVWRKDGKAYSPMNIVTTVKFGGGRIRIWGCFSAKDVGKISVIDVKMNAQKYKQILQENLMSSVESLELPSDYIY